MRLLITGGSGFIGSALIRYLLCNTKHTVINVDKLTYAGSEASLSCVKDNKNYYFEKEDICCSGDMHHLFNSHQPDVIIHLAAETHVDNSIRHAAAFINTNIMGTYVLLEASKNYYQTLSPERQKKFRFYHISTDEVYGDLNQHEPAFSEKSPYAPHSPYSASKASSDHLVRAWHKTHGLPILISNCSNNYGPYQFPEKLIPLMIKNALLGNTLPIYGDGLNVRDWLFVEDHVSAIHTILTTGKIGETYNIGGASEKTNLDVVNLICHFLEELAPEKPKGVLRYENLITFVKDRPGHDKRYAIDAKKIEQMLHWKPKETFETGLYKTVAWYAANHLWLNRKTVPHSGDTVQLIESLV